MDECKLTFEQVRALVNGQRILALYPIPKLDGGQCGAVGRIELVPLGIDDSTDRGCDSTILMVGFDSDQYCIDLFINEIKTSTVRRYDNKLIALADALRIMTELRLPPEALIIQFK